MFRPTRVPIIIAVLTVGFLFASSPAIGGTDVCPSVPLTPLPVAGYQYDPVSHSRFVYVVGGYNNNIGSFDSVIIGKMLANGTIDWNELDLQPLPVPDQGPSLTIANGWLYAVLGSGHVWRAQLLPNGALGSWIDEGVGMPFRGGFMSAEAYEGFLYVMGGFGDGNGGCGMHADVIVAPIYADGSLGDWVSTSPMPQPRQHQSVHFFKGRAYIAGGISGCTGPILGTTYSAPVDPETGLLGNWRQEASLPQTLWYHKSVLVANEIIVYGGRTTYGGGPGGFSSTIYRGTINPADGTIAQWDAQCSLPNNTVTGLGAVYVESMGVTLLIGGYDETTGQLTSSVWRTNLPNECQTDGFWNQLAAMPVVSNETSAVEVDGMIYVFGNNNGSADNDRLYRYDPATDTWTELANMPTGRGQGAAAAIGHVIYYFGGNNCTSNCWVTTVDAYDIDQGTWSSKASLPGDGRGMLTAVAFNNRIYVMGGVNSYTLPTYSYNHIYDPQTDSWSAGSDLPRPRSHHAAVLLNGKIYLIGGDYRYSHSVQWPIPEIDVYDPANNDWSLAPDGLMLRAECSAVTLNSRIYILGGREKLPNGQFGNALRRVEEFDPTTNCWRVATSLPSPRYRGCAVACSGRVWYVGGNDSLAPTSTLFNGVPLPLRGDLNHDGVVDLLDLTLMLSSFGSWLVP